MTKVRDPLFSRSASGRFARDLVYASWRGIPYVRLFQKSNQPETPRQRKVNVNFGNVSQRWAGLSEEQREAWRRLAAKWPTPTSAHCQFISSATLALDAGLPEPVFPPRMRKYDPPRLKLNPDKKLKALVLSWSIPKLPDKSLADIYFCSSKASHSPDSHRHHHLAFLPAKERHFVLGDPKPNVRYSFRVRIILPDSNHSPFSAVSLVYEGF